MTPRTVNIVCAKAPRRVGCVPAVRQVDYDRTRVRGFAVTVLHTWRCSFCGARVRVVA